MSDSDSNDGINEPAILRCRYCPFLTYEDPDKLRQHVQDSHSVDGNAGGAGHSGQKVSTAEASTTCDILPEDGSPSKSKCPIPLCEKEYTRSTCVRRHMITEHKLSRVQASKYTIMTVKHCCPHCGKGCTNLSKHYRHCKKKNTSKQVTSQGSSIVSAFNEWLQTKDLATKYVKSLVAKLRRIISCWEEKIPNFEGDNLLDPIKKKTFLPSLALYHSCTTTLGDKQLAIKTYVSLCDFLIYHFDLKYTANQEIDIRDRTALIANITALRQYESLSIKKVKKQQQRKTKLGAEEKARDPEQLSYNPERLRQLVTTILRDKKLTSMREMYADMSPRMMKKNHKEITVRHFLMSQLWVTGAGHRPSAITYMRVGEVQDADNISESGVMLVHVKHHKTVKVHGPAKVPFLLPGLFKATSAYIKAWRDPENKPDELVFAKRGSGEPADYDSCIRWLIRSLKVLTKSFSLKELTSLSGGTMRKGWTNWAKDSQDEFTKQVSDRVMCHSEKVSNIFYRKPTGVEVGVFASKVLQSMDPVENFDTDTSNTSDSIEEGEIVSPSPPPLPPTPPTLPSPPQQATSHREGDNNASNSSVQEGDIVFPSPPQHATPNREEAKASPYQHLSESERELICSVFSKDGQLPKSITSKEVAVACEDCPEFKRFYDNLVLVRGRKWLANRALSDYIKSQKIQKKHQNIQIQKNNKTNKK